MFDVVQDELEGFVLLTVVLDSDRRAALDSADGAVLVVLAVAEPLTKIVLSINFDQGHGVSLGESLNKTRLIENSSEGDKYLL